MPDQPGADEKDAQPLAQMMRLLWGETREQVHATLIEAGYVDIQPEYFVIFQWPGPDGERPTQLAERVQMSKQAINYLIRRLEDAGYLERQDHSTNRTARIIRLTPRGKDLVLLIRDTTHAIEREWQSDLDARTFEHLRAGLTKLYTMRASRWEHGLPSSVKSQTPGAKPHR
jgi:DNA-binding MarR family transcriptional regulator